MSFRFAVLLLPTLALTACASSKPDSALADLHAVMGSRAGGALTMRTTDTDRAAAATETTALLKGPISLDAALKVALLNAPDLQARLADLNVAAAERAAASEISNPVLSLQARPTINPAAMANLEFGLLGSVIELLTRPARERVAAGTFDAAKFTAAAAIVAAATDLRAAYIDLIAAQHSHAVQVELTAAATTNADLAERFFAAGNIPAVRLKQEQAAAAEALLQLSESELEIVEARERVALRMGVDAGGAWSVPDVLPASPATLPVADDSTALNQRLDVAAARAAAKASVIVLKTKTDWRLWRQLDLDVSAERDGDGQWAIGPRLEIALPLFTQGRPDVARAVAEVLKVDSQRAAVELAAKSDVRLARAKVVQAERRLARYRTALLPLKTDIVDLKVREYNAAFVGAFDVLMARKEAATADLGYVQALRSYWQARAGLDAALGSGTVLAPLGEKP